MNQRERDAITRGLRNLNSYFKRLHRTQELSVHQLNSLDYLYRVEEDLKEALNGEKNE